MNQGFVFQLLYNFYGYKILQNWKQPFLDFGQLFRYQGRRYRKGTLSFHRHHREVEESEGFRIMKKTGTQLHELTSRCSACHRAWASHGRGGNLGFPCLSFSQYATPPCWQLCPHSRIQVFVCWKLWGSQ